MDPLLACLAKARRRIVARAFLETLVDAFLISGAACLLLFSVALWMGKSLPMLILAGLAAGALVAAAIVTIFRWPGFGKVAQTLDRLAATKDRFVSGLELAVDGEGIEGVAARECREFVSRIDLRSVLPIRVPGRTGWLVVPAVGCALVFLQFRAPISPNTGVTMETGAQQEDQRARELEQLAAVLDSRAKADELKKLAEAMKASASKIRGADKDQASKVALRELSSLESMISQMQSGAPGQDLAALAEALEKSGVSQEAAKAIEAGKLEEAAKELQKLAKGGDKATMKSLEKAIREISKGMAGGSALGRQMAEVGKSGSLSQQALEQMAQALRQAGGSESNDSQGQQSSANASALQKIRARLQELKQGEAAPQNDSQMVMESFGQSGNGLPGSSPNPGGNPSDELDRGLGGELFGEPAKGTAERQGPTGLAQGVLGQGESLTTFSPASGDDSKARQRYRELYQAMAPAAESAVLKENIPLGSRFFVKRYFQNIRPKETQ